MKKFMKRFRYDEKGFTLIELLIVVAVLGILAAVIVPNIGTFLGSGQVAAANTEVAMVETAALAFYADNGGTWPTDTDVDLFDGGYLSADAIVNYGFDGFGRVSLTDGFDWPNDTTGVEWDDPTHKWIKL